jgi:hypothetical protein
LIRLNAVRRVGYSLAGLCAGNVALLGYLLLNALQLRHSLLSAHIGEPHRMVPQAFEMFLIYAVMSFFGWTLIGLPVALVMPPRVILRMPWPAAIVAGACCGPAAIALLVVVWTRQLNFAHTESYFILSILVSTVAFVVYRLLLEAASRAS